MIYLAVFIFQRCVLDMLFMLFIYDVQSVVHKASGRHTDVNIKFLYYGAREGKERSGAYLFIPDGIAQVCKYATKCL